MTPILVGEDREEQEVTTWESRYGHMVCRYHYLRPKSEGSSWPQYTCLPVMFVIKVHWTV